MSSASSLILFIMSIFSSGGCIAISGASGKVGVFSPLPSSIMASCSLLLCTTLLFALATVDAIQGEGGVVLLGVHTDDEDGSTSSSGEESSAEVEVEAVERACDSLACTESKFNLPTAVRRSRSWLMTRPEMKSAFLFGALWNKTTFKASSELNQFRSRSRPSLPLLLLLAPPAFQVLPCWRPVKKDSQGRQLVYNYFGQLSNSGNI
jgi:hypothetical protein